MLGAQLESDYDAMATMIFGDVLTVEAILESVAQALKIVKQAIANYPDGEFLFPGQETGKPLSSMALEMMLRRMKILNATFHGFRSSFRDRASECTNFTNEVREAALAHVIKDKTEVAYRRGDLFEKRGKLMEAWVLYCATPGAGKVMAFRKRAAR